MVFQQSLAQLRVGDILWGQAGFHSQGGEGARSLACRHANRLNAKSSIGLVVAGDDSPRSQNSLAVHWNERAARDRWEDASGKPLHKHPSLRVMQIKRIEGVGHWFVPTATSQIILGGDLNKPADGAAFTHPALYSRILEMQFLKAREMFEKTEATEQSGTPCEFKPGASFAVTAVDVIDVIGVDASPCQEQI